MLSLPKEEAPPLVTAHDFQRFADFFYRSTGILFGPNKRYFVDRRLQERIVDSGHRTFGAYFDAVRLGRDDGEYQALVNAMTINETYFYRETLPARLSRQFGAAGSREVARVRPRHPHLVDAVLDRRGALLDRVLPAGALEAGRRLRNRDRRLRHRHRGAAQSQARRLQPPLLAVCSPGDRRQIHDGGGRRPAPRHWRAAQFDPLHPRQPASDNRRGRLSRLPCHLLPQSAHLLRRRLASRSRPSAVRGAGAGRLRLSRPLRNR